MGLGYGNNELGPAAPEVITGDPVLLAIWIVVIIIVLCATGRWWGLVFVVPLILDLYLLRRIFAANSDL